MGRLYTHAVDQKILERIVASPLDPDQAEHEAEPITLCEISAYLDLLPPREVDLLELHALKKKQKEMAMIFSISQGAVSHRLARAAKRIQFLRDMPKIEDSVLMTQLREVLPQIDAEVTFFMIRTTCQSRTAQILNERRGNSHHGRLTQVKVRHKFHRAVGILKDKAEEFPKYQTTADLAAYILKCGLYMLHEVKLPHFYKGEKAQIDMAGVL